MVDVDRALLREPFDNLRAALAEQGVIVNVTPMAADQIRAAFRMDLTQAGVDTGDPQQVAGALAGLAISVKMLGILNVASTPVVAQFVGLFDVVWPILDEDFDAEINRLAKSWGVPRDDDELPPEPRGRDGVLWDTENDRPLPDLPKVPTADKPVVNDMTAWARRLAGAQPDLHMTPEQILQAKADADANPESRGFGVASPVPSGGRRPQVGGPRFNDPDGVACPTCGGDMNEACPTCHPNAPWRTAAQIDDDEVVDAVVVDEDDEAWEAPEPRPQRRHWWGGK